MKITVCTFVYNSYGVFIPRWLKSVQLQTYPAHEIIVVLGHNHGIEDIPSGVKVIHYEQPATMGFLRNLAVDLVTGDYVFFVAADDILFGNALQEISNVNTDIIALRYYQENKIRVTPEITAERLVEWRKYYIGACGYWAFKKGLRHEDTNCASYPLLLQAYKKGYTFKMTKNPGAVYIQRPGGYGQQIENRKHGLKEIEKYLLAYGLTQG